MERHGKTWRTAIVKSVRCRYEQQTRYDVNLRPRRRSSARKETATAAADAEADRLITSHPD